MRTFPEKYQFLLEKVSKRKIFKKFENFKRKNSEYSNNFARKIF